MNKIKASFGILILLLSGSEVWAQFNPPNPDEPFIRYKIELECTPVNVGWVSGDGQYSDGTDVCICTQPNNSNYEFQYWEHNGEVYTRTTDFVYRINTHDAKFIAHYEYKPSNPEEPDMHFKRRIYLKSQPEKVATFNYTSGAKFELGEIVPIQETWRSWGYEFKGWYEGEELISNEVLAYYTVTDRDVTLVAHYEFNPDSPEDPGSFYSESCEFLAESSSTAKGTVAVEGLEKGRAVFGSTVTLIANPTGENSFCGWYMGDSLISESSTYSFVVPSTYSRMHIVALFLNKPHNLTYLLDNESFATFVVETGDSVTILSDVAKDGYAFSGWQGLPDLMPDSDVVVTGLLRLASIRISQQEIEMDGGNKMRMVAYVGSKSMEQVTDVVWSTENQNIATISRWGILKGVQKGTTFVSATLSSDAQVSASALVNVISDNNRVDLPSQAFEFNYNAVNYDAENNLIRNDLDAELFEHNLQLSQNVPEFIDGNRLSITKLCKGYIDKWNLGDIESGEYFKRSDEDCLTIICKVKPRSDNSTNKSDFISLNSSSNTNYSFRIGYKNAIYLATTNSYAGRYLNYLEDTEQVFAVKVRTGEVIILNLTTGESKVLTTNTWGGTSGSMNFFYSTGSNYFVGDFYWTFLSKEFLSDSEIWDVVDYNENVRKDSIPDVIMGDANNSGAVNVTDISVVVDYLFGNYPHIFKYKASDVNLSREVNVADIAGIVNLIYGLPAMQSAPKRGKGETGENGVELSCSEIIPGGEGVINVNINNTSNISAVQMDLRLPEGLTVIDAEMDADRGGNRTFRSGYVDGVYKLMSYSMENESLNGNEGKLFSVRVKASEDIEPSTYGMSLTDIVFSGNGDEIKLNSVNYNWDVKDLISIQVDGDEIVTEFKAYDLLGREVDVRSMKNGPYILRELSNGKAVKTYKVIR